MGLQSSSLSNDSWLFLRSSLGLRRFLQARVAFLQKLIGHIDRIDFQIFPPSELVSSVMNFPVMQSA